MKIMGEKLDNSGGLKNGLVSILNGLKEMGLQTVWISNGIWNPESQPFGIQTNGRLFVQNHLKFGKNVCILNSSVFKWLGV